MFNKPGYSQFLWHTSLLYTLQTVPMTLGQDSRLNYPNRVTDSNKPHKSLNLSPCYPKPTTKKFWPMLGLLSNNSIPFQDKTREKECNFCQLYTHQAYTNVVHKQTSWTWVLFLKFAQTTVRVSHVPMKPFPKNRCKRTFGNSFYYAAIFSFVTKVFIFRLILNLQPYCPQPPVRTSCLIGRCRQQRQLILF